MQGNQIISLTLDSAGLEKLIQHTVQETVARLEANRNILDDKIAYNEAEAASLLSLEPHQLRDERRRGRIGASVGPGRKILYSKADLLTYLASRRWEGPAERRG